MPPVVAAAAVSAGGALFGAGVQSHAAGNAVKQQTSAANYGADRQAQAQAEALAFEKSEAARAAAEAEATRKANYDQWAARESRIGSIGEALGYGPRNIPAYVPIANGGDPLRSTMPPAGPSPQPVSRPLAQSVGGYLAPPAPTLSMPNPYAGVGSIDSYLR